MHADVRETERPGVLDQHAQYAVPLGKVSDARARGAVDPERQEPLEAVAAVVQDAERGVPSTGEVAGGVEDGLEHGLEVQIRHKRATHLEQTTEMDVPQPPAGFRSGKVAHGRSIVPILALNRPAHSGAARCGRACPGRSRSERAPTGWSAAASA